MWSLQKALRKGVNEPLKHASDLIAQRLDRRDRIERVSPSN